MRFRRFHRQAYGITVLALTHLLMETNTLMSRGTTSHINKPLTHRPMKISTLASTRTASHIPEALIHMAKDLGRETNTSENIKLVQLGQELPMTKTEALYLNSLEVSEIQKSEKTRTSWITPTKNKAVTFKVLVECWE